MPRSNETPQLQFRDTPLLILMDGHALVHRAWHAIQRPLTVRATGEVVHGVYGFVQTFLKALQEFHPTHVAISFDRPTPTFRHIQFEEYKAQRPAAPQELRDQFVRVRQVLEAFHIPIYEIDGFEADDVLGTLCKQAEEQGLETVILTGDTDTLQLVSPLVKVALHYRIQERLTFDEAGVRERYGGLAPQQLSHLKALRGDPTDNIPGVPGVGEKTAIRLLLEFGTVQGLYQRLDQVPDKLQEVLRAHREQVFRGLELTSIVLDVPMRLDLEACRLGQYNRKEVVALFRELEFFSLVERVPEGRISTPVQAPLLPDRLSVQTKPQYQAVTGQEGLEEVAGELERSQRFAFDVETTGLDPVRDELVGVALATAQGRAAYIPMGHLSETQLERAQVLGRLKPLLEGSGRVKIAHNGNFDMMVLAKYGLQIPALEFDTMLAAFLLGRKAIDLKALALDILGEVMTPIKELIGAGKKQRTMAQVPVAQASPYACADADMTLRLATLLEEDLKRQGFWELFTRVEMPLVPVLVQMQFHGIRLDVPLLREMSRALGEQLKSLEEEVYNAVGHQFNINSPKQLSEVLFGELRLARTRRTKTGYSTDAAVLETLRGAHPVIDLVLKYRELSKLKSTYVDALPEMVNPRTGRVHTSYNQAGAITGRISSNDPNLQNIPIRTELGRQIRKAFIPEEGWLLVAADYSQIELRVLAHLSQDPNLLEAFHEDLDIHAATASQVYGLPLNQVTPDMRRIAKVLNFGVIYGLSAYGVSQQTELSAEQGAQFIESYLTRYPGIREYVEATKRKARELGYVETLLGRRRSIPEIHSGNATLRSAAEREAINMPVQGTAAEVLKLAMVRLARRMGELGLRAHMLLQVHDELIFEAPPQEIEPLKALILEVMPTALELAVPLKVTVKVGPTWGDVE